MAAKVGTWGDYGFTGRKSYQLGDGRKLTKITVYSTDFVSGIEFTDVDADGKDERTSKIGGKKGEKQEFSITDGQKITKISGSVDVYKGTKYIKSLQFEISSGITGGTQETPTQATATQETPFSLPVSLCEVSGFFGSYEDVYLESFGVMVSPSN